MGELYIITGPAGVGKSTISKKIAENLSKSVLLEGDEFYAHVVSSYVSAWKDGNHLDVFWKECISSIKIYLEAGYDVVFNYIIGLEKFNELKEIFNDTDMKFVVLLVDESIILKRDSERPIDCQMKDRCIILLNNFKNYGYNKRYILDTSDMSVEETVDNILNNDRFIANL